MRLRHFFRTNATDWFAMRNVATDIKMAENMACIGMAFYGRLTITYDLFGYDFRDTEVCIILRFEFDPSALFFCFKGLYQIPKTTKMSLKSIDAAAIRHPRLLAIQNFTANFNYMFAILTTFDHILSWDSSSFEIVLSKLANLELRVR